MTCSGVTSRVDRTDVGALNEIPREFHYLRVSDSSATSTTRVRGKFARQLSAMLIIHRLHCDDHLHIPLRRTFLFLFNGLSNKTIEIINNSVNCYPESKMFGKMSGGSKNIWKRSKRIV